MAAARLSPRSIARWAAESPATVAFGAINLAAMLWLQARGSPTDVDLLVASGALERGRVWAGEPWRLLTAAFLHGGWIHFTCNTVFGVPLLRAVERVLGTRRFVLLWLASAVGGSALSLLGQDEVSVGASGALLGATGAALVLHGRALGSWRAFLASRFTLGTMVTVAVWSAAGAYLPLDQLAHFGGLATGVALTLVMVFPAPPRRRLAEAAFSAALLALVLAAAWPRPGTSAYEARRAERGVADALAREDADAAARLLDAAFRRGVRTDELAFDEALVRIRREDYQGALMALRPLAARAEGDARRRYRIALGYAAAMLAWVHREDDPALATGYALEACAAGHAKTCEALGVDEETAARLRPR